MGCVHTHQGVFIIEGWGSPNHVWSVVQKIRENNQKVRKSSRVVTKHLPLGQNMIKSGHNGPQMSLQKVCWKGSNGADILRWNFEVEPYVT